MTGILKRIYKNIYILMLIWVGISIFISDFAFPGAITNAFPLPHWAFGISAGMVLLGICFCAVKSRLKLELSLMGVFVGSVLLGILQFWLNYNRYFYLGWDVGTLFDTVEKEVLADYIHLNHDYFSIYPNNLLVLYVYKVVGTLARLLGIDIETGILALNQLVNTITGLLAYFITDELYKSKKCSTMVFALYHLFLGFSPWFMVPYTDGVAIVFPVLMVYIYLRIKKDNAKNILMMFFLGALVILGIYIKPQIVVSFIAIVIMEILYLFDNYKKISIKYVIKFLSAGLVGIIFSFILYQCMMVPNLHMKINKDYSFGPYHYIMMGLNKDSYGSYSNDDALFSLSCPNQELRVETEKKEIARRLYELGPIGLIELYTKKMSMNYGDGTFSWFFEDDFYWGVPQRNIGTVNLFLYNWILPGGNYYNIYLAVNQLLWIMFIIAMFAEMVYNKEQKIEKADVLYISAIGITLFELLFEARARYLFAYAPFYIILASAGIRRVVRKLGERIGKNAG